MLCSTARWLGLTALLIILSVTNAGATGKIAIDALHGLPEPYSWDSTPDLLTLYPDYQFIRMDKSRAPIYTVLAEGIFDNDDHYDSVIVSITDDVHCLYVVLGGGGGPFVQYAMARIVGPDQTVTEGGFGVTHVDNPELGLYTVYFIYAEGANYRIGTGPFIWEVYPPDDYDAIVDFHCITTYLFTGRPTPRTGYDIARIQQFADSGGGVGLYYDNSEPIALKPIIRLRDFAASGATIRINLPGHLTYSVPPPQKTAPLTYEIAPIRGEVELDYEAEFHQTLNFVARGEQPDEYVNPSWATVRDVKILRFIRHEGYRISHVGTLAPGEDGVIKETVCLPYSAAAGYLDNRLRYEASQSGLTADENDSFFTKYQWAQRMLGEACRSEGVVVLYRIEGADYDALFPLSTDPVPTEIRRVIWVFSILPDAVTETHAVHPRVADLPPLPSIRQSGVYHEYGFFREYYGGDALDEMDAWGWHLYDQTLVDSTDPGSDWSAIRFDTWGASPLSARLSQDVTHVESRFVGGIAPTAGNGEVVLSGDEDTHTETGGVFPEGSYPPVAVARQETNGGRFFGCGDLAFLADYADNRQFTENVFAWLTEGNTGNGPDIDIPVAVIEMTLAQGGTAATALSVKNLGTAPLMLNTLPPFSTWFGATGPSEISLAPGDSADYTLSWTANDMEPGYYSLLWIFNSNDPNESLLAWPVRLKVAGSSAVNPGEDPETSRQFRLLTAYPNPFNPRTTITFTVSTPKTVVMDLYNIMGQQVERISRNHWLAGTHTLQLDLKAYPAGLYFLRAEAGSEIQLQKLMLLK